MAEDKKQKKGVKKPSKPLTPKTAGADIRKEAEKRLRLTTVHSDNLSPMDMKKLVHELQVHQIELEMQNEEIRNAQDDLEKSRSRYADLYDFSPISYLTINTRGIILESNLTAAKQLGTERSQLINKPLFRFIHKDDQDLFYLLRKELLENGTRHSSELRLIRKDRSLFYARLEYLAVRDVKDEVRSIRIAIVDVTDRVQVEEELKIKQHLNEVLLDSLPHPAMLIRKDRIILAANRIAREVGAKVGGLCWQEFGHGEYIPDKDKIYIAKHKTIPVRGTQCYFCKSDEAMQNQAPASTEVNSFNRLWDTYWVPLDEETYLHYALDITEQKQVEEKLKSTLSQVEKANRELSDFAYIVSHDLKEPLRALNSLAKWIVVDYADKFDDAGKEKIGLLINRVRRMNDLVEGILRYSRAGRIIKEAAPQDLNRTVSEVVSMLNPPAHISVSIVGRLPVIVYERSSMQQVFQNLIENAVKYMNKPEGSIKISAGKDGRFWKICVSDNGPGIDEKDYDKIFQMFGILQPRDMVEASGVGLAIVKKIVRMYGGNVWVESEVGKGSRFYFTIPE